LFSQSSDCGCNQAPACGCQSGPSCWERLRAHFHREECGCDTGSSSCGCNTAPGYSPGVTPVGPATPPGEPIKPPKDGTEPGKKLPEGDKPKDKEARIPAPFQVAPASTKVVEKDNRNPF